MAENEVVIEVKLDDGSYRKAWVNLQNDSKEAGKQAGDNLSHGVSHGFEHVLKEIAAVTVAYLGLHAVIHRVSEGIQAAIGSENAFQQLNLALAQNGAYSEQASEHLQHFIHGLEKTTATSDAVIASGASMLAGLGRLSGEGLDRATKAALDLAAGLQKGPEEAFMMLSKAAEGSFTAFGRYGFKLVETGDKAADFARLMDQVNARFGGMAENRLNTFGGSVQKLGVSFEDFLKQIGFGFTKSAIITDVIQSLAKTFDKLGESLKGFSMDKLIIQALDFASVMVQYVIPPFTLLYNVGKILFNALETGFQTIIVAAATMAADFFNLIGKFTSKYDEAKTAANDFAASSEQVLIDLAAKTSDSMDSIFDFSSAAAMQEKIDAFRATAGQVVAAHSEATQSIIKNQQKMADPTFMDYFVQNWAKATNSIKELAAQMVQTIRGGLVNTLSNGFAAMGKALVSGENLFAAFGKAILSGFGQMLIQLGTQVLMVGLLMQSVPILFGLQGFAAVVAGAGMIIAGGVLSALGGSGGGGAAGGGGGGAAAPTGLGPGGGIAVSPVGAALAADTLQERQEPNTQVVVNIHGNVLDRRSTGLELAEVMRENFELHGVTFAGAAAT